VKTTSTTASPTSDLGNLCTQQAFRLAVYEAGQALSARYLGLRILSVRMLPRPPVLTSDKVFKGNDWLSFIRTLEIRIIELFGGQFSEEYVCSSHSCCNGDIARIDELTRMISGLENQQDPEQIWFELEDISRGIFTDPAYQNAIFPIANFLHQHIESGCEIIDGPAIETKLDQYVPRPPKQQWLKRIISQGRKSYRQQVQ